MDNTQLVLLGLAVVLAVGLGVVLWRRRGKAVEIPQPTVEKAAGLTRAAGEAGAAGKATDVRETVNGILADLWPRIQAKQAAYYANHGHYWQGLWTHNVAPADGVTVAPNNLDASPTDQPISWRKFKADYRLTMLAKLPMAIRMDVYDGPRGKGYVATCRVGYNGKVYERAAQVGPETELAHGWQEVDGGTY